MEQPQEDQVVSSSTETTQMITVLTVCDNIDEKPNCSVSDTDHCTVTTKKRRPLILLSSMQTLITRFHAGHFRISLSLCGQALLWKVLIAGDGGSDSPTESEPHALRRLFRAVPQTAFSFLWSLALFAAASQSLLYSLRCVLSPGKVKAEFLHRVGVNYLFAPWISCLLLLQSSPFVSPSGLPYRALWWAFVGPIVVLDVKIYGQWFTKGKRFLSAVANPASHVSVIGNLVAARAAAEMGSVEAAICLFSLGVSHYLVVFVTLYQRLSGTDAVPAKLRPSYFLFVGAPSMAGLTWRSIAGEFDCVAKMFFFLSLFLFMSLVTRPALFRKSMRKFDVAWWGYSFPVTVLALASVEYADEVRLGTAHAMMIALSGLSFFICLALIVVTAFHSNMLFPENTTTSSDTNIIITTTTTTTTTTTNTTTNSSPRRCDFA